MSTPDYVIQPVEDPRANTSDVSVEEEEAILTALYGPPNDFGFYTAPGTELTS